MAGVAGFHPDHRTPVAGMPAWDVPDPTRQPVATAAPRLLVQVIERQGDWSRVLFDNGWSGWVDGRLLEPLAPTPTPTPAPATAAPRLGGLDAPVELAGVRITAFLFAGAALAVAAFLPWVSQFAASESSFGVPISVLFDPEVQATGGVKIGFVVVPIAAVVIASAFGKIPAVAGRVAGGLGALIATVFVAQLQRALGQAQVATVFGVLGMGVYLTMVGGVIAAMSRGGTRS